ncbi:MAG: sulfatase [Puniceicoccaceae bacterium]
MKKLFALIPILSFCLTVAFAEERPPVVSSSKPNVILVMTDDQGWGQTGYYNHPVLKTPNLDKMAEQGLRMDRFYSGASNCSPTRASVMTGRTNDRTGVLTHGHGLHSQEKTIAQALQAAGYNTAHFGKWHLNYLRGAGAPILAEDPHGPGKFGFDYWLSVTNFFDLDPLMSRNGTFEKLKGDSSEVAVAEALKYIKGQLDDGKPFFTVIWFGSPHSPFQGLEKDLAHFPDLVEKDRHHYAELVAMDRSIGTLRKGLRKMGVADNTIVWFNSDNGGLPEIKVDTVGGLKGNKNTMNEGGIRVPCVIEWPKGIKPKISSYPAFTADIFPTIASVVGLPRSSMNAVIDGIDISPLFTKDLKKRKQPIPFCHNERYVIIDNNFKLMVENKGEARLYDLDKDFTESDNVILEHPEQAQRMMAVLDKFSASLVASRAGADYPEGVVLDPGRIRQFWAEYEPYWPHLERLAKEKNLKSYVEKHAPKE